jgi:hypothetical protein
MRFKRARALLLLGKVGVFMLFSQLARRVS